MLVLLSLSANAADFTVQLVPADASVSDVKVTDVTMGKVTGLSALISSLAKLTDIAPLSPAGSVMMFGGATAPSGWLFLQGQTLNVADYPALFAAIGYTHGGSGATFMLPDTRGIFVRGMGAQTFGSVTYSSITLGLKANDQFQGHNHLVRGGSPATPNWNITVNIASGGADDANSVGFSDNTSQGGYNPASYLRAKDIESNGTNGTPRVGNETNPANITLNYMIKY